MLYDKIYSLVLETVEAINDGNVEPTEVATELTNEIMVELKKNPPLTNWIGVPI